MDALIRTLWRRKLLVAVPIGMALAIGILLTQILPRRYTAEAVLAVDARKVQIAANEVVSRLSPESAPLRTELDIIASRSLAEHVAEVLHLDRDAGVLAEVARGGSFFSPLRAAALDAGRSVASLLGWPASVQPPWLSDPEEQPVGLPDVVDWLVTNTKASNDNRSVTIFVSFTSSDAARSAAIANALARGYLTQQVRQKNDTTSAAAARLAEKLVEVRKELATAESAVAAFRRVSGLLETKGSTVAGQQLSELNTQIALARAERARAEAKLFVTRGGGGSLPEVLQSQTIQELRAQLSRAEVRLAENARNTFLLPDLRTSVDQLRGQIAAETARIAASVAREADAAAAKEASLTASLNKMLANYGEASAGTVQLNQLLRDAEVSRTSYESLLTRFKQATEHEGLAVPDALLISEAQPPAFPASPKVLPLLVISGLCGLVAGGIAATLRDRFDDRIFDLGRLADAGGAPVFGVLPRSRAWDGRKEARIAVQWLRTTVQNLPQARQMQVILVTSATRSEGRSDFCKALAREFVRGGERVLVVESDPARPGAVPVIAAPDPADGPHATQWNALTEMVRTDVHSSVHFVTFAADVNLGALVRSGALAGLIDAARQNYHTIILDAAPVLESADAALFARVADVRLFVVRYGQTRWGWLRSALAALRLGGSAVDGIVVVGARRNQVLGGVA